MRTTLHRFLLILLMLTLPLQAFASASMPGCVLDTTPADPMQMVSCHESAQATQPDTPPTPHNCKHCAACALPAALPVSLIAPLALMPTAERFIPLPVPSFNGFIPDSPERPPRLSLA